MCTYLKNMEGYKINDLKLKDFDSIQEMFDRAFKRVNTFEDFRTELVEGKEKTAGAELSTFLDDATCAYLYVRREEVSPCTTYTFNDVGKEAYD
ncbi:hypothetical protein Tco_1283530 [Tanacetum coccineum]